MEFEEGKYYYIKAKMAEIEDDDTTMLPYRVQFTNRPASVWVPRDAEIVEEIPKAEKATIPKFVAEWIEKCKKDYFVLGYAFKEAPAGVKRWLYDGSGDLSFDVFARAWLDGYKIEKELLYRVILPNPNQNGEQKIMLKKQIDGSVIFSKSKVSNNETQLLTEQEIKKDFEWAWQFAKPVEEDDE